MNEIKIKAAGEADVVVASDGSLNVTFPIKITRRGRRKAVMLPDGTDFHPRDWDGEPTPIQVALARGHRWLAMLESGQVKNLTEIGTLEGIDNSYVSRMVNLTSLAPDIVAAILDDTLPNHVTLFDVAVNPHVLWEEQQLIFVETNKEGGSDYS
jgi:hypothetical protein